MSQPEEPTPDVELDEHGEPKAGNTRPPFITTHDDADTDTSTSLEPDPEHDTDPPEEPNEWGDPTAPPSPAGPPAPEEHDR